jgi:hypothetical protein
MGSVRTFRIWSWGVAVCAGAVCATAGLGSAATASAARSAATGSAARSGSCLRSHVPLSVEESRLTDRLPRNDDPAVLQSKPFAQQIIDGAGFQGFAPALTRMVCRAGDLRSLRQLARLGGARLWRAAVNRAQSRGVVRGSLPASDDRPLYWTRLQALAALRRARFRFPVSAAQLNALLTLFDKASRGMFAIHFPSGHRYTRVILSGFDPYTLDGGPAGTAPGAAGNNIRHGNPSGATALALDGARYRLPGGKTEVVQTYLLPVNYREFQEGYLEDTVGPWMKPGPRRVAASITMSQTNGDEFDLEQWNGRYQGVSIGNDNLAPCPNINGAAQVSIINHSCDIAVVPRWGGPSGFNLTNPPQWTKTSLPIAKMIAANTGLGIPRPPGDSWPDPSVAFGVVWHTDYVEFPNCGSATQLDRNDPVPTQYPPPTQPVPPDPGSCAYQGGGGAYLSNESAYRNTLLRDRLNPRVAAGHIHTPYMQNFAPSDQYDPSDSTFAAWRAAILAQGKKLVRMVAENVT